MEFQKLSLVVPLLNEAVNIKTLYTRLTDVLIRIDIPYEIIMVDDGSQDTTPQQLVALHRQDDHIKIITLRRNFGQHSATFAGFDYATGDIVVTIDADLQNDPADIARLIDKMREGYDVVSGWRVNRQDPLLRRKLPSLIVNWFIASRTGLHLRDYGCGLKAYTNRAAKEIAQYGRADGWYPILFSWLGYSVEEVEVNHYPRAGGKGSRYDLFAQMNQFMSLFTGLATRPFQLVELLGGGITVLGMLAVGWAIIDKAIGGGTDLVWALIVGSLGIVGGIEIGVLGLLGEYLVRIYYEVKRNPKYLIDEIIE